MILFFFSENRNPCTERTIAISSAIKTSEPAITNASIKHVNQRKCKQYLQPYSRWNPGKIHYQ